MMMNIKLGGLGIFLAAFLAILAFNVAAATGELQINAVNVKVIDYEPTRAYNIKDLRDYHGGVSNNSKIEADIFPGSKLEFEIEVENTFKSAADSSNDTNIKDVTATLLVKDIDDGSDIEEDSTDVTLEPTDSKKIYVIIGIPKKVIAKTFEAILDVDGNSKGGVTYTKRWELKLPVKKVSHDVRVENVVFDKSTLSCWDKAVATVSIYNAGREEESDIKIGIKNDKLGINMLGDKIALSSDPESTDSKHEQKFTINIPNNADNGNYQLLVDTYWKGIVFYTRNTDLTVSGCAAKTTTTAAPITAPAATAPQNPQNNDNEPEQTKQDGKVPVITGTNAQKNAETEASIAVPENTESIIVSKEFSIRNSKLYIPLLSGFIFLIILTVAAIALLFVKKLF